MLQSELVCHRQSDTDVAGHRGQAAHAKVHRMMFQRHQERGTLACLEGVRALPTKSHAIGARVIIDSNPEAKGTGRWVIEVKR
jgi:hypothetical protein